MPTAVENGLIVGAFPTFGELIKLLTLSCTDCLTFVVVLLSPAMIVATFVLQNIHVSEAIEAGLQNFAAGLIIAAVAAELFPIMIDSAETPSYIGITIGFLIGLCTIYGLEGLIDHIESSSEEELFSGSGHAIVEGGKFIKSFIKTYPKGFEPIPDDREAGRERALSGASQHQLIQMSPNNYSSVLTSPPPADHSPASNCSPRSVHARSPSIGRSPSSSFDENPKMDLMDFYSKFNPTIWEEADVEKSVKAISIPQHRQHIYDHLQEVYDIIKKLDENSTNLGEKQLTLREQEEIAEQIDESCHILQYKLDHTRR
jgi:hypothetical protein